MLDNSVIYWDAESGTDHNHSPRDLQYLLSGGRNLGFTTGQFLQPPEIQSARKLTQACCARLQCRPWRRCVA
jgi:hypothetical protein